MALHLPYASILAMRVPHGLVRERDVKAAVDRDRREKERKATRPLAPATPRNGNEKPTVVINGDSDFQAVLRLVLFRRAGTDPLTALMTLTRAGFDTSQLLTCVWVKAMARLRHREEAPSTTPRIAEVWKALRSADIPQEQWGTFIDEVLRACPPRGQPAETPSPSEPRPVVGPPAASPAVEPEPPAAALSAPDPVPEPVAIPSGLAPLASGRTWVRSGSRWVPPHARSRTTPELEVVKRVFVVGGDAAVHPSQAERFLRAAGLDIQACCERARQYALARGAGALLDHGPGLSIGQARQMISVLGLRGGPAVAKTARAIVGV